MDFSKVRLADFAQARLRDVPTASKLASSGEPADVLKKSTAQATGSDICAHAPQYTVRLIPLNKEAVAHADDLQSVEFDSSSGYALAVAAEGLLVWKQSADNSLLFPLPRGHEIYAKLIPAAEVSSAQPGFVTVDRYSGQVTYWESVNRAVSAAASTPTNAPASELGHAGVSATRIALGHKESVDTVELIPPYGLVTTTSAGHFYLVNLRDDMGKRNVQAHQMRAGSGILARLRSLGAFAHDITSVRAGNLLPNESLREVYIANRYGDVALWHVGLNGLAQLIDEAHLGTKLSMQMDILYPNAKMSLVVHDLTVERELVHVLASFAPYSNNKLRYFVVMSLTPEFEVVSVRRLQSYESPSGVVSGHTSLNSSNGVLTVACGDAVILVDSPSRSPPHEAGRTRWEECLYLKPNATLLGAVSTSDSSVSISTATGILSFVFSDHRDVESTTKARLEQAVFEAGPLNPLDLTKWCPSFEAFPDSSAPQKLALEIANSQTPYVPAQLPELSAHLELRVLKLGELYKQAPIPEVREIAQTVVAAAALHRFYEASNPSSSSSSSGIRATIDSAFHATSSEPMREVLLKKTELVPEILNVIIGSNAKSSSLAELVLSIFQDAVQNGMGLPKWATEGSLRQALESLTAQAVEAKNADVLALTTEILCAINANPDIKQETQSGTIKQLLRELSLLDNSSDRAIEIASKYRVYSALAPLEVGNWLSQKESSPSGELENVCSHINEFGESYATAVFDTCISSGNAAALVEFLAPLYHELVSAYLDARGLPNVAWTLNPGTAESTGELKKATEVAQTLEARRIYASLYKISAHVTRTGNLAEAQKSLDLVAAQETLRPQLQSDIVASSPLIASSSLVHHGLEQLEKLLDHKTAVDLLAMAPAQAVPENNNNFILGFKLVDPSDTLRQRLLVQQLVCNTNWDRVSSGNAAGSQAKRLRQTLFFHTLRNVPQTYAKQLQDFRSSLVAPSKEDVRASYSWDVSGSLTRELEVIAERAMSIADKYNIDELIRDLDENVMEVDE